MYLQSAAVVVCLAALCLAQGPSSQYLPPNKGYDYPRPLVPFPGPSSPGPSVRPPQPTPTPFRPKPTPPPTYTPSPTYLPQVTGSSISPGSIPSPTPFPPEYNGAPTGTRPTNGFGPTDHLNQPHVPGMPFDFNYVVKDDYYGTDYSHNAISDGDQVKGEYRVQLPDGRVQIVSYVADWATGYHANVRYEGEARYPENTQGGSIQSGQYGKPSQSYGPPQQPSGPY